MNCNNNVNGWCGARSFEIHFLPCVCLSHWNSHNRIIFIIQKELLLPGTVLAEPEIWLDSNVCQRNLWYKSWAHFKFVCVHHWNARTSSMISKKHKNCMNRSNKTQFLDRCIFMQRLLLQPSNTKNKNRQNLLFSSEWLKSQHRLNYFRIGGSLFRVCCIERRERANAV